MPKFIKIYAEKQPDLNRSIVGLIFEVTRQLGTAIDRRVARFNVTGQQAALLVRSSTEPDLTPTQLAPWLGTDNAGITRLVDRLEVKGLVARRSSSSDRRVVVIQPTEAGYDLVPHLIAALDEVTIQLFGGFTPEEISLAESTLRHFLSNLEIRESGPAEQVARGAPGGAPGPGGDER